MRSLHIAPLLVVLAACGGASGGDPETLIDGSYVVTSIQVGDPQRQVLGPVTISFTAESIAVDTPCNDMGGPVSYSSTELTVGPLASTEMACEAPLMEQDQLLADVLSGNPSWQVADGLLTLTSGAYVIVADSTADGVVP